MQYAKYILMSILVLILFAGCGYSAAYYKTINDPNSDYNKYKLWRYASVGNETKHKDILEINSLNRLDNDIEINVSYYRSNIRIMYGWEKKRYIGGGSYILEGKVPLLNESKPGKYYPLDTKHLEISILVQNNECSYDKLEIKREILSKRKIRFTIPQKYKNRFIQFVLKTKGLDKNKKIKKCINCNKLC